MADDIYAINDKVIYQTIVDDLLERGYLQIDAEIWVREHGSKIISNMWDEYTRYIEDYAEFKDET